MLGDSASIDRMVTYLEKHGTLTDADWDSIASIGPALNRTVEQLRRHAVRTLKSFDADLLLRVPGPASMIRWSPTTTSAKH